MSKLDKIIKCRCDDVLHGYLAEVAGLWGVTVSEAMRKIMYENMRTSHINERRVTKENQHFDDNIF